MMQTVGPNADFQLHLALSNIDGWPDSAPINRAFDGLREFYALNHIQRECERIGSRMIARFWDWQRQEG